MNRRGFFALAVGLPFVGKYAIRHAHAGHVFTPLAVLTPAIPYWCWQCKKRVEVKVTFDKTGSWISELDTLLKGVEVRGMYDPRNAEFAKDYGA